jgi:branched-chain amino acid transport system substrate-binding protein
MRHMSKRSNRSLSVILAAGMLAASVNAGAAPAARISGGVVRIGILTDLSGVYSDVGGKGSLLAAQMAMEDFKASAKPGFKIEFVSADHQNKPDIGAGKAREWYDVDGVDMITDGINSAVALAVARVTSDKGRLFMVTGAGTTRLTNEECAPDNLVHYGWDTRSLANGQARALAAQGKNSWFFMSVDYVLGRSLEQDATQAVKATGGTVLGSVKHPLNASDFSSFMLQAQSSKAQVIGLANGGGDLVNAVKVANEYGVKKKQIIAGLGTTIGDIHAMGLATAQGMLLVEDFYWDLDDKTREWSRRFAAKQKKMPNMIHAATYSAVLTYLKAVQQAGTDATPEVMKQLRGTVINDVFARNGRIREDGRMVHPMFVMEVKNPSESKGPWDYYHVRNTIPPEQAFPPLSQSRCGLIKK